MLGLFPEALPPAGGGALPWHGGWALSDHFRTLAVVTADRSPVALVAIRPTFSGPAEILPEETMYGDGWPTPVRLFHWEPHRSAWPMSGQWFGGHWEAGPGRNICAYPGRPVYVQAMGGRPGITLSFQVVARRLT